MQFSTLGRYEILAELGRGTMGVVYRGRDPVIDREVAIKTVVFPDGLSDETRAQFLERFFLEARIAGKLVHPNIVITYDAATDEDQDLPFIVMELVDGHSLDDRIKTDGKLPWKNALDIVIPVAQALTYASEFGIVHRDVKPANVLLSTEGTPKLTDFGIAKLPTSSLTKKGIVLGTPAFISPEQLRGEELDGRADIFSLGAVLYTAIVGESPFAGPEISAIFHKLVTQDPEWPSQVVDGVPPAVDNVIAKMLAKDRDDRYATGAELANDLIAVRAGEESTVSFVLSHSASGTAAETSSEPSASTLVGDVEQLEDSQPPKPRRWFRWGTLALLLAGVTYGVAIGPDRVVGQLKIFGRKLEPAWSWIRSETQTLESDLRDSKSERDQRETQQAEATALLDDGDRWRELGKWTRARNAYENAFEISRAIEDGRGESRCMLARGQLMARMGEWERSRADFDGAARLSRLYEEDVVHASALLELGNLARDLGKLEEAEQYYSEVSPIAESLEDKGLLAAVSLERSLLSMMRADWEQAEEWLRQNSGDGDAVVSEIHLRRQLLLGVLMAVKGDAQSAEAEWSQADELCRGGDRPLCTEIALWRGRALMLQGDLESAQPVFSRTHRAFQRVGDLPGSAAALENLAEISERIGENEKATELWTEAAAVRSELGLEPLAQKTEEIEILEDAELRRFVFLLGASRRTATSESRLQVIAEQR